ncbi:LOW QUALITY PROTEIN: hypothetical protein PanWU01x14_128040 [Parasponia andersonii]|uniref:Uncharacterized protein n=1 Tax=Parasponia andersonii TaxID=3476 RepID=A0A2P5CSM1_PARAD|nr:LOW QUALITY PROTEIN: hypothetical protein PanWU01x14_128040 [Parasponia andersonii]
MLSSLDIILRAEKIESKNIVATKCLTI